MQIKDRKKLFIIMNLKYKTIENKNIKWQSSTGKTNLNFHKSFSNFYDEMNSMRQSGSF